MARHRAPARPSTSTTSKPPYPSPFEPASDDLKPFLNNLLRNRVYITHIDPHPSSFKKRIFAVPVLLNLLFVALLAWRAYVIVPWYSRLLLQLWYLRNSYVGELYSGSVREIITKEARHFLSVFVDYVLITVVAPWPWSFFFERPGNPTAWRMRVGFKERELVVRVSRGWEASDLLLGEKRGDESPFWKTRILPAVRMDRLGKTGYLLMDADWDLDFRAMVVGQEKLVRAISEEEVNGKVWAFWRPSVESDEREGQWVVWDFRRDLYAGQQKSATGGVERVDDAEDGAEVGRRMIMKFKDKLEEMGKEELFYRWVELIQYESSRPGGFTTERQIEAGQKVKELFVQHGVDFEEFERAVGIEDGVLMDEVD